MALRKKKTEKQDKPEKPQVIEKIVTKIIEPEIKCVPDQGVFVKYPDGREEWFLLTHRGSKVTIEKNA